MDTIPENGWKEFGIYGRYDRRAFKLDLPCYFQDLESLTFVLAGENLTHTGGSKL
jgi:hypothetical protein